MHMTKKQTSVALLALLAAAVLVAAGCGGSGGGSSANSSTTASSSGSGGGTSSVLVGAGSTFVYPLVSQWIPDYSKKKGVTVTYGPVGSGAGIEQIINRTIDFGASDAPMTADETSQCKGCLQVPWALSATADRLQPPGRARPSAPDRAGDRGHLPRQDQGLGRPRDQAAQPWRVPAVDADRGHPPQRRQRHDVQLHRLPRARQPRLEAEGRSLDLGQLADRAGRQGKLGRLGGAREDERRHHVHRRRLRAREPLPLRLGQNRGGKSSCRRCRRSPPPPRA